MDRIIQVPGIGKITTTHRIMMLLKKSGMDVMLAVPTDKFANITFIPDYMILQAVLNKNTL